MIRKFALLGLLLLLGTVPALGCGGAVEDLLQNFTFSYNPEFTSYQGGTGVTSPLAGAWRVEFAKAIGGGRDIYPATAFEFVAQATSAGKAIAFLPSQGTRGSSYVVMFLSGSSMEMRIFEYAPRTDRVVEIVANGTLDLGTGTIAVTQYSVKVIEPGSERDGTGTFSAQRYPFGAPAFTPLPDGNYNNLKFDLADDSGRGDLEAFGIFDLDFTGDTVSGTAAITIENNERQEITRGSLDVEGTRVGTGTNGIYDLVITGAVGGVAFTGTAIITAADADEAGTGLLSSELFVGIVQIDTANSGATDLIKSRKFAGCVGRTPVTNF